ncbi:uncharacterized protein TNIN_26451 [Trichonephila inaurata madagascariensis]|uniref:Laminin subunit alpha-2 n=1 Tax=Trichonephila inaurata madagascariensis TaxID=2747483 RepID=A0A8X6I691_9ARAC|nr:uncharacterized protein TNIN_26451 [Trichonephila inaurata madagascariensis]
MAVIALYPYSGLPQGNLHSFTMKLLAVLILSCFALASAVPLYDGQDLQTSDFDDFMTDLAFEVEERATFDEVKNKLKDRLDDFIKKVKDAIDQGKAVKGNFLEKMNELREKMKKLGIDFNEKSKNFFDKIGEQGRDFLKKILENLGIHKRDLDEHVDAILLAEGDPDVIADLKAKFKDMVKRLKDAFESGKSIKDALEKLDIIRKKLKEYNIDLGDFGGEFLEQLKDRVKDYWKKLKEKLGAKRSADIDVFGMFEQLKELIKEKFNPEKLKELIEKYFGKGSEVAEQLISILKEKGEKRKQRILDWLNKVLGEKEQRSVSEVYEKIRDYFKDLNIELRERFSRFGQWVKDKYEKGLEKSKDKLENVKRIAKEFLHDTKNISKDVAEEALGFFREYKDDLGLIFEDVKEKARQILKEI